ncbi:S-adenosyl-L-methionine-dependent methyltransferase [Macrophomina phaseolina]|uniref:DNA (cytosine-5-)-methyltransferase n=1 Tax=Macrophomina phaseolina TaxID=35725 RepID=A0ABQ8GGH5_9PEZI|nr:S-adenosyl-L-methionine-dependent methyltransferase [Macrophomina phaseolina]
MIPDTGGTAQDWEAEDDPIVLSDDEDDPIVLSDDEDDQKLSHIPVNNAICEFISLLDEDDEQGTPAPPCTSSSPAPPQHTASKRNSEPQPPDAFVTSCNLISDLAKKLGPTACRVRFGDTVELSPQVPEPFQPGDFLRVVKIVENLSTGQVVLRGLVFRRNKYLAPMLSRTLNETHLVVTIDADDPRPYHVQGLEEIALAYAIRKRRLVVTNRAFPELSWRGDEALCYADHRKYIYENEVLVCRNVFANIYGKDERARKRTRPWQGLLRFILPGEADDVGGILTGLKGEDVGLSNEDPDVVAANWPLPQGPNNARQYSFADGFQGAGGASQAAEMAGLKVKYGFDHNIKACRTATRNFPRARIYRCEASDFPPPGFDPHVDILHLSPPCQPFSWANTRPNEAKNEKNTDAILALGKIIRAVKPRLVTMEEVDSLARKTNHSLWFGTLLGIIIDEGYSVRWAIHTVRDYGVSQPRKRLALIAARPGVPLPEMPPPTHGPPGSGLLPYVSVRTAIGGIPRDDPHHNPQSARRVDKAPYNPDKPFDKTIVCSNSEAYHWSGRKFTNRELAGIQGFPPTFQFVGCATDVETQIGNAVPPPYFKNIFMECIKTLRKVDGEQGHTDGRVGGGSDADSAAYRLLPIHKSAAAHRSITREPLRVGSSTPFQCSTMSGASAREAIMIDEKDNDSGDERVVIDLD